MPRRRSHGEMTPSTSGNPVRPSIRALGVLAVAATLAFTTSAPPTELLTDPLGDGNGINGQGLGGFTGQDPSLNTAPANANADLTSLAAATLYDEVVADDGQGGTTTEHVVAGLRYRLGTAGAPTATDIPTITRIRTIVAGCTTWIQFYAGTNGSTTPLTANVRLLGGCGLGTDAAGLSNSLTISGDWLSVDVDDETGETVFDIDLATAPEELTDYLTDDAQIQIEAVEVRFNSGLFTAPVIDEMLPDGWTEFTVGEDVPDPS